MERSIELEQGLLTGWCDPALVSVLNAFVNNFNARGELGAGLAIYRQGTCLVDLVGGFSDKERQNPWQKDTVCVVHSCTKAATALCLHHLIDQGDVQLNDPVARFWPEYGQSGKRSTTLAMLLNHTSGIPALRAPLPEQAFLDWPYMTRVIAEAAPFWEPGTQHGYQMTTFGWLIGEVVRRVSGQSLGQYFKTHLAEPLGADFWIGLPEEEHHRVAKLARYRPQKGLASAAFTRRLMADPEGIPALAYFNTGKFRADAAASYSAEFGAGGGIGSAQSLARLYGPLANGGCSGGQQLLSERQVSLMADTSIKGGEDRTLIMPTHFSLGFMKSMDNFERPGGAMESLVLGSSAFGHAGAGGSLGFADPGLGLSLGYVMNQMGPGILVNERGQSLVDAVYAEMGQTRSVLGDYRDESAKI